MLVSDQPRFHLNEKENTKFNNTKARFLEANHLTFEGEGNGRFWPVQECFPQTYKQVKVTVQFERCFRLIEHIFVIS